MKKDNKTILVIEDDPPALRAIHTKLVREGFNVVPVKSASQALNILLAPHNIDLIWLDHYIPSKDGVEFLKEIKGNVKLKNLPVFVVTNSTSDETKLLYMKIGIDKYYVKVEAHLDEIIKDIKEFFKKND